MGHKAHQRIFGISESQAIGVEARAIIEHGPYASDTRPPELIEAVASYTNHLVASRVLAASMTVALFQVVR